MEMTFAEFERLFFLKLDQLFEKLKRQAEEKKKNETRT